MVEAMSMDEQPANNEAADTANAQQAAMKSSSDHTATQHEYDEQHMALVHEILREEWRQFQATTNEGGRAACQDNRAEFDLQRAGQFLTWPDALLREYLHDLQQARADGRNLVTEKYARMMASTAPLIYARDWQHVLPALSAERVQLQEHIIAQQVAWAKDFVSHYPKLGAGMRVLTTSQDSATGTSFETYLRGELSTYSDQTLASYAQFIDHMAATQRNLTQEILRNTVTLAGYQSLEDAESHQ